MADKIYLTDDEIDSLIKEGKNDDQIAAVNRAAGDLLDKPEIVSNLPGKEIREDKRSYLSKLFSYPVESEGSIDPKTGEVYHMEGETSVPGAAPQGIGIRDILAGGVEAGGGLAATAGVNSLFPGAGLLATGGAYSAGEYAGRHLTRALGLRPDFDPETGKPESINEDYTSLNPLENPVISNVALPIVGKKMLGSNLVKEANKLEETNLGISRADITKSMFQGTSKSSGMHPLEEATDTIRKVGGLGKWMGPEARDQYWSKTTEEIGANLDNLITKLDEVKGPIKVSPDYSYIDSAIDNIAVSDDIRKKAAQFLAEEKARYADVLDGSAASLQNAKKSLYSLLSKAYSRPEASPDPWKQEVQIGVARAFKDGLDNAAIAAATDGSFDAGSLLQLNKLYGAYSDLKPSVTKAAATAKATDVVEGLKSKWMLGLPLLADASAGSPGIGTGITAGLMAADSNLGRATLSSGLRGVGTVGETAGSVLAKPTTMAARTMLETSGMMPTQDIGIGATPAQAEEWPSLDPTRAVSPERLQQEVSHQAQLGQATKTVDFARDLKNRLSGAGLGDVGVGIGEDSIMANPMEQQPVFTGPISRDATQFDAMSLNYLLESSKGDPRAVMLAGEIAKAKAANNQPKLEGLLEATAEQFPHLFEAGAGVNGRIRIPAARNNYMSGLLRQAQERKVPLAFIAKQQSAFNNERDLRILPLEEIESIKSGQYPATTERNGHRVPNY